MTKTRVILSSLFSIVTLFLVATFFVLQGASGLSGTIPVLIAKFIPLPILTGLFFVAVCLAWKINLDRKKASLIGASVALIFIFSNITFQKMSIENYLPPFSLSLDEQSSVSFFSGRGTNYAIRLGESFTSSLALLPWGKTDREIVSYMRNTAFEAALIFRIQDKLKPDLLHNVCKRTTKEYLENPECEMNLVRSLMDQFVLTETGNILVMAVVAAALFKRKKYYSNDKDEKDDTKKIAGAIELATVAHLLEASQLIFEASRKCLLEDEAELNFSMGYKLKDDSALLPITQGIILKFMKVGPSKTKDLKAKALEKAPIESPWVARIERVSFKAPKDLDLKIKTVEEYAKVHIEQLKEKSILIRLSGDLFIRMLLKQTKSKQEQ